MKEMNATTASPKGPKIKDAKTAGIRKEWFVLRPNIGHDTFRGETITSGTVTFGTYAATATVNQKEIQIIHSGATLVLSHNGRECALNLEHFIKAAMKAGLVEPKIDFKEVV